MEKPRPPEVQRDVLNNNIPRLRERGRKGGLAAAENRRQKKAQMEEERLRLENERRGLDGEAVIDATRLERTLHPVSDEGDVLPPPPTPPRKA